MHLREELHNFIVTNFLFGEAQRLADDDSFLENGIIDSTGILELVSFLEERYSLVVEDSELIPENLDSINRLVAYVQKKVPSLVASSGSLA